MIRRLLTCAETKQREARHERTLTAATLAHRFATAYIVEDRMLGSEPLLRVIEGCCLLRRVNKGFHRTDGIALVGIGFRILQRLNPVTCKNSGVLLRA